MEIEKFEMYLAKARLGNQDAKERLVLALDPLLKSSIKKYCPIYNEFEDLYQDGQLIILECIDLYDPTKARFLAFVKNYLRYYYLDTFKYLLKEDESTLDSGEDLDIFDFLEDDVDLELDLIEKISYLNLKKNIKALSARQRQVINMFYFLDMSLNDIAKELNVKRWTVINTKRRALEILREVKNDY